MKNHFKYHKYNNTKIKIAKANNLQNADIHLDTYWKNRNT